MPFHISHPARSKKFKVVGPFKDKPGHVYGTHSTAAAARQQQKALYANVKDAAAPVIIQPAEAVKNLWRGQ